MGKRILVWLFSLLLLGSAALAEGDISSKAMLNAPGRRIGVSLGSAAEVAVASEFPEAKVVYFTDKLLGYTAVAQGKLDAYVYDRVQMQLTIDNGFTGVHLLPEVMDTTVKIAVGYSGVSGIPDLRDKLNRFVAEVKADGTLDDMYRRWVVEGNSAMPEIPLTQSPQVHLTVGTTGTVPPYSYYEGKGLTGFDVELARRFAAWLGADLSLEVYDFDGVVPAAKSGKIDVIMSNLQYLPERSEGLLFSDTLYEEKLGIMVRGDAPAVSAAPSAGDESATDAAPAYAAYNGKRLGVLTGPLMEDVAREYFPDSETLLFNSYPDCITALLTNKIDAYLGDELGAKSVLMERPDIDYIRERITENNYSFAFRKNDQKSAALCGELNAFLAKCWAEGTMDELDDIWFGEDEARKVVDMSDLTGENGTIKVVTTSTDPPFSYIKDGKNVGYDIDLVVRFCRDRGYALELGDVDFAGRIPAIESGKYDFTTDMNVTPEREEQVLFSDPVCKGGIVLVVRKEEAPMATESAAAYTSLSQLNGKRIGVQTGTVYDEIVLEALPDAQISYFNTFPDMAAAMEANKIDGFPGDEPVLRLMAVEDDQLAVLNDYMESFEFGFVMNKTPEGDALTEEANAWLSQMRDSGELDALIDKWVDGPESEKIMPDYTAFPAEKGTLRFATEGAYAPMNYFRGSELVGFEVELAARFCEANGYGFSPEAMNFDGILPAVQTGKVDFGGACISITEERRESVNFSDPYYICRTAMCVLKDKATPVVQTRGYNALSDLAGKRIGVQTGTSFDKAVFRMLPDAKVSYFNTKADLVNALLSNKIDAYTVDEPVIKAQMQQDDRLTYIPEYMERFDFAYVFPKTDEGQSMCDRFNEYLRSIRSDGTMAQIEAKWFGEDDSQKTIADYRSFPAPNGTLRMATEAMYEPFSYILNNEITGYDIDIVVHFCEACGYGLKITDMSFDAVLMSVQSGKCDFGGTGITITDERRESVLFSEPNFSGGTVMAVLKGNETPVVQAGRYDSLSDMSRARVGVATGTTFDAIVRKALPDAKIVYINSSADLIASLEAGKIDGFAVDEPASRQFCATNARLAVLDEYLDTFEFGFVLPKTDDGEKLQAELDAWLVSMKESGALEQVIEKWTYGPEDGKTMPDYDGFPAPKGTLTLVTEGDYVPMNYYRGSKIVGAEIDLAAQFCEASGYGLEIKVMNFDGILPAVQSGKADLAAAGISITDERRESVRFSVPYYSGGTVMVVLKGQEQAAVGGTENATFLSGIASSFEKTFIREGRWRLFVDGVITTLLITMLSILFGTALGFVVFMLCRNGNPVANLVTRFCLWLVQGMPMVVLLMILYYVVFGSVAISGIAVAVVGFTLTFGAAVFGLLKMGVGAVDGGQYEAAYALGYSNRRTFFKIILPQALPHVLPAYRGEIVGLIKATAIVGYIAVQDLTKMGDIVRSRTYEAFFPLIAVTIIYFILEGLIGFIISRISVNFNPKRRKPAHILKGVKTDDQN